MVELTSRDVDLRCQDVTDADAAPASSQRRSDPADQVSHAVATGPSPIRPHSRPFYSLRIQSRATLTSRLQASRLDRPAGHSLRCSPTFVMFDVVTSLFSPHDFNPLNLNPLKDVLEVSFDFEALRRRA
jgi:hypothetical protein